jgi:lactonase
MRPGLARTLLVLACLMVSVGDASADGAPGKLAYDGRTRGPVPLPPGERDLQTVTAEPWFKVSDEGVPLEGPSFDRAGGLLFTDASSGRILRLTPDKRLGTVVPANALNLGGLAIHADGRIFAAGTGGFRRGSIVSARPDGSDMRTVVPPEAGYVVNDLVFDAKGGFYFTDFRGTSTDPKGGVYYVAPDLRTVTPVLPHLVMANGVALSPDGKVSGPRSSAATSCTGSSSPTRLPRRRWGHRSPTVSPGRRRTRCGLTPTATSTSPSTARAA